PLRLQDDGDVNAQLLGLLAGKEAKIACRHDDGRREAFRIAHPQQRLLVARAITDQRQELFRRRFARDRPQTRAGAAGEQHGNDWRNGQGLSAPDNVAAAYEPPFSLFPSGDKPCVDVSFNAADRGPVVEYACQPRSTCMAATRNLTPAGHVAERFGSEQEAQPRAFPQYRGRSTASTTRISAGPWPSGCPFERYPDQPTPDSRAARGPRGNSRAEGR